MRVLRVLALAALLAVSLIGGCRPPHESPHPPEPPKPSIHVPDHDPFSTPIEPELGAAGEHAAQEGKSDPVEKEVICFAYKEFYDPSTFELRLPTVDEFVQEVFEKVRPKSEEEQLAGKVKNAYGLVQNVSNLEVQAMAERLACA